ncbi:negative cofactor 2 transcriptional co-repressor, putative [Ricinus communis]|uniref:Negative cofactor 2 transcriptional co-repressor, putative n=1 Tax=Ricinus communis TaxID=3988 RepID=B9SB51_RICCO|nr:negative cofactor 2 transcriptional co-repressor, putative [Ricinus communis]|eukprot:XP_002523220.1 dr1-associated corepressor [Ricinus communis]
MKKKLDTRFPAARIKKIMQADDDVGKIALAVPLLVSKALELFLQDLCDRTYAITLRRGAKTLNSLHLKQCVHTFNIFDFLGEIVGKVPDLGGSGAAGDDCTVAKRRKVADDEDNDSDAEYNRSIMHEVTHTSTSGRGRGRGRVRGRSRGRDCRRGSRATKGERAAQHEEFEDEVDISHDDDNLSPIIERLDNLDEPEDFKGDIPASKSTQMPIHDFDLNVDLDENGQSKTLFSAGPISSSAKSIPEMKHEELSSWSLADSEKMDIDPIHLAYLNRRIDEAEEDYDEED